MLTVHLSFKLTNFTKALGFQMLEVDSDFWTDLTTLFTAPHATSYTATNGLVINFGASANITTVEAGSITISGTTFNLSTVTFASDTLRDTNFEKIVSALHELVLYVLAGGSLPTLCRNCFNFKNYTDPDHFCNWIDVVTDTWDIDAHYCSQYNVMTGYQQRYEVYEF